MLLGETLNYAGKNQVAELEELEVQVVGKVEAPPLVIIFQVQVKAQEEDAQEVVGRMPHLERMLDQIKCMGINSSCRFLVVPEVEGIPPLAEAEAEGQF